MKIVAVGSLNPVKLECVRQAFTAVWPDEAWDVIGVAVSSGVSDQPMSADESIRGATNRAHAALAQSNADFGVGLEGGLEEQGGAWFDSGWVVVVDREGKTGIGSTIRMATPKVMLELIRGGMELGDVDDKIFDTKNSKHADGHFGLMTKGALTRTAAYRDGLISALTPFIHPELH